MLFMKYNVNFILVLLFFMACSDDVVNPDQNPKPSNCIPTENQSPELAEINESVGNFGISVINKLNETEEGNVIISPLSIYSALLMLYEGSDCNTYTQIIETLGLGEENINVDVASKYKDFINQVLINNNTTTLKSANVIFSDPNRMTINPDFVSRLRDFYEADSEQIDFSTDEAVSTFNQWASDNTEERIKEVLDEIANDEVLFLINATYFIGDWINGFDDIYTAPRDFNLEDGTTVPIPMMFADALRDNYQDDNLKMVDMMITDGYAASFVMPTQSDMFIKDFLAQEKFMDDYNRVIRDGLTRERLALSLPKFELSGNYSLKTALAQLGMPDAFSSGSANLSRMGSASGNLFVGRVKHDTYLKIDEKGIEGAAVTTIGVAATSVPPPLIFNRPFVMIVRHVETGVPIFIGKIQNPLG